MLFSSQIVSAQKLQAKIDSLRNNLQHVNDDSTTSDVCYQIATLFITNNPDSCFYYGKKSLKYAGNINWNKGIASSQYVLSMALKSIGSFDSSLLYQKRALKIYQKLKDSSAIGNVISAMGNNYNSKGDYVHALEYFFKGLHIAENLHDTVLMGKITLNIGLVYYHEKNYKKALEHYAKALKIQQKLKNKNSIGLIYMNTGLVFNKLHQHALALENYLNAIEHFKAVENKSALATAISNIGTLKMEDNLFAEGLDYQWQALNIFEKMKDKSNIGRSYNNLGESYLRIANCPASVVLPDSLKNKQALLSKGAELLAKGIQLKKENGELDALQNAYHNLSYIAENKEDYKYAFENLKAHAEIKDSVFNISNSNAIATLEARRESELKEKEIQIQKLKLKAVQNEKWTYVAALLFVTLLSMFYFQRSRLMNKISIERLRSNIAADLHDEMGSTLSSISLYSNVAQSMITDNTSVHSVLQKISTNALEVTDTMSDIVWSINTTHETLDDLIRRMRGFAVQLAEAKHFELHFNIGQITPNRIINSYQRKNIYLIFKEVINNAAKYADCKNLWVDITLHTNSLGLAIRDDGKGFEVTEQSTEPKNRGGGNGLFNIKKRVDDLNASLKFNSKRGEGTDIMIQVKLKK